MGPLADLHLHLYGCIRSPDLLRHLASRDVDWSTFEAEFKEIFERPSGIEDILARHRAGDPLAGQLFHRLFVFGDEDGGDFRRFQAKFNLLIHGSEIAAVRHGTASMERIEVELHSYLNGVLADQAAQGIDHAEYRMFLSDPIPPKMARSLVQIVARRMAAWAEGEARLAVSLPREDPWPQWEVVEPLLSAPEGRMITGIDFCSVEEGFPPRGVAPFFEEIQAHNARNPERAVALLYHVGESFRDKSLESAIRWVQEAAELGAHRLGHAIALGIDPAAYGSHDRKESISERIDQVRYDLRHRDGLGQAGVHLDTAVLESELRSLEAREPDDQIAIHYDDSRLEEVRRRQDFAMQRVRATGAVIEVCPTSNRRIAGLVDATHHPVHRFLAQDLPVVVASDDPGIFDTSLADEIEWVRNAAGLDTEGVATLIRQAWQSRSEVLAGRPGAD